VQRGALVWFGLGGRQAGQQWTVACHACLSILLLQQQLQQQQQQQSNGMATVLTCCTALHCARVLLAGGHP
jgi:hypothetical protein